MYRAATEIRKGTMYIVPLRGRKTRSTIRPSRGKFRLATRIKKEEGKKDKKDKRARCIVACRNRLKMARGGKRLGRARCIVPLRGRKTRRRVKSRSVARVRVNLHA